MPTLDYQLDYGGVPLLLDEARVVRLHQPVAEMESAEELPPRKHQPVVGLLDEIDKRIPFQYLQDCLPTPSFQGRNLSALAGRWPAAEYPSPDVRIGDWYYPAGASRWSVFRGLATSSMVKKIADDTKGFTQTRTFTMKAVPVRPNDGGLTATHFTLTTSMYCLPPRPLAEHGGGMDGLYLVTLVDERWHWQKSPVTLHPTKDSTWTSLVSSIGTALGVTITHATIPAAYGTPEPDSHLWVNSENAAILLDAVAANVGCVVVRSLAGTYQLQTYAAARDVVASPNRGTANRVVRAGGGDMFTSGTQLKVGNLVTARNAVVPNTVRVTFPKYVIGNDPVPHWVNPRTLGQSPGAWFEESYGDTHNVSVGIASGGALVSGVSGIASTHVVHSTAKALYSGEANAGDDPRNVSGLTALAMRLAQDHWESQAADGLDEVYPGTLAWTPEALHDVIWTYSARAGGAYTRVIRSPWNQTVDEGQHAAPALSGSTSVPRGVTGKVVPQTVRDSLSTSITTTLGAALASGDYTATLASTTSFPQINRWRGQIDNEVMLFNGASGGTSVGIVWRGIDGTIQTAHDNGSTVTQVVPNAVYGANLWTFSESFRVHQGALTSGGVNEVHVGIATAVTAATINSSQNDYNPGTADELAINADGSSISITGFSAGFAGRNLVVFNTSAANTLTLSNQSASSLATSRIVTATGTDLVIPPLSKAKLNYDTGTSRWYVESASPLTSTTPLSPAQITANQNDYGPGYAPVIRLSSDASRNVTGMSGGYPGYTTSLYNTGSNPIVLTHQDSSSAAGNRFLSSTGSDLTLAAGQSVTLFYDGTTSRWRDISASASSPGTATASAATWTVQGTSGVVAAGTTQGTATQLNRTICIVTSGVAASAEGVILPASGSTVILVRAEVSGAALAINVYPPTGGRIDRLAADAPYVLADTGTLLFCSFAPLVWYTR